MFRLCLFTSIVMLTILPAQSLFSQSVGDFREEINIYNTLYDAPLHLVGGADVSLHELAKDKPIILALVFSRCSGVCNPLVLELKENLRMLNLQQELPYSVLVLSFDPWDKIVDMQYMAERFNLTNEPDWYFGVTDSINQVINSVGFKPIWDEKKKQFDHDALLAGVSTKGKMTKKLLGLRNSKDLRMLVQSINKVFIPSYRLPTNTSIFTCFNYDPETGKIVPGTGLLIIIMPVLITWLTVIGIRMAVRKKTT